jgi:formate dehydrogenase gamma subunit
VRESGEREYERFTLHQRVQHILLFVPFFLLVITGFPLKYPNEWWATPLINLVGGWEMRGIIHRASGLFIIGLGIYHGLFYIIVDRNPKAILPQRQDFRDFVQHMKWLVGKAKRPRYGRYSWKEKFEYWGAGLGMAIMGSTGVVMMFPDWAFNTFPLATYQVLWLVHSNWALFDTLVILIWHMGNVHFTVKHFPMDRSWISGKIPERRMKEDHPLEYEEMMKLERGDSQEGV